MLGLRLRNQIASFLFLLFTMVVLTMGYFNVSILKDQLRRLTLYQARSISDQLFSFLDESLPQDIDSIEDFVRQRGHFNEFLKMASTVEQLRNLVLYDAQGRVVYSRKLREDIYVNNRPFIEKAKEELYPQSAMWLINPRKKTGKLVKTYGLFDSGILLNDYYYPILRKGKLLGVLHVSLRLEKASRLLRFFFVGNLSISIIFIMTAFIAIYVWSEHAINRPLRNLLRAQERLRSGDFDAHVDLSEPPTNELSIIAHSFNDMAREIKRYQERLKEQAKELEEINKEYKKLNETLENEVEKKTMELREFFSLITHDLKIPLAAIKGYVDLLKKEKTGPLSDKQRRFINSIETATLHLLSMVKNMLDSVKYEDGRVEYFMEEFDLLKVVYEIKNHFLPIIHEKKINLLVLIPDECRSVYGDRAKIGQVISNILNNAINYTPNGGDITITATEVDDLVEVRIRDSGKGIHPEQLERIFEKFQQIPGKETPSTSLGLGLYIVRKIMEGHGMKAWAESTLGKGSSFYFTLRKYKA